jgi:hypothetical protein
MDGASINRGIHAGHGLLLLVPGLVALLYLVEGVRRFFARVVRAEEILARAGGVSGLYRHVTRAEPPLALLV